MKTRPRLTDLPDVLYAEEIIALFGMGKNQVYDALKRGEIPAKRIGRRWVVSKSALQRWLDGDQTN